MAAAFEEFDINQKLMATDCHFNWGLEDVVDWITVPSKKFLEEGIKKYNFLGRLSPYKKYSFSLAAFYITYKTNIEGSFHFLENANRILNLVTDPHGSPAARNLPSLDSHLYKCPVEEFFAACCAIDDTQCDDAGEMIQNDEILSDRLEAATHILRSLQAHILRDKGAPSEEIVNALNQIVPIDSMDIRQGGFLRVLNADMLYELVEENNLDLVIEMLKLALERDPDDWMVASKYLLYTGYKRRRERRNETTLSDVEEVALMTDRFRNVHIPATVANTLKFYELEVLAEHIKLVRGQVPRHLIDYRDDLCEELVDKVKGGELTQCALIMSGNRKNLRRACELAETALTHTDSTYANAKAANIFWKANRLERALECATLASKEAIGSCWQVLELKLALGQNFDAQQFFYDIIERFPREILQIHMHAFVYYALKTENVSSALVHYRKMLEQINPDELPWDLEKFRCSWSQWPVNTAELAYRIALYFLQENEDQLQLAGPSAENRHHLSEDGLKSCRIIVSIIDSMPEVKSRFEPAQPRDLDGIINLLTGCCRKPVKPTEGRPQAKNSRFFKNRFDTTYTNWRKK